jgi:glucuronosyltransferase
LLYDLCFSLGSFKGKLSPNIKTVKWLPQNDILGHVKTKLFITHAGANGLAEAAYHGVPMICSPFFGDQHDNSRFVQYDGLGEILPVGHATAEQLVSLINQVINEKRYESRKFDSRMRRHNQYACFNISRQTHAIAIYM